MNWIKEAWTTPYYQMNSLHEMTVALMVIIPILILMYFFMKWLESR